MESVPDNAPICPPEVEEIAEAYCMGRLPSKERVAFEDHFVTCTRCTDIVANADEYIRAMKTALRRLRSECDWLSTVRVGS
jgi:anti-sigma factor RsiW